jgi:hypothetical protein
MHILHDPISVVGLQDNCPDCVHKVTDPVAYLDSENFRMLWAVMLAVEFSYVTSECPGQVAVHGHYRTKTEAAAADRLLFAARVMERCGINPREVMPR